MHGELRNCPFCGGHKLTRPVYGRKTFFDHTHYFIVARVACKCGGNVLVEIDDWRGSWAEGLRKARKMAAERWNSRHGDKGA